MQVTKSFGRTGRAAAEAVAKFAKQHVILVMVTAALVLVVTAGAIVDHQQKKFEQSLSADQLAHYKQLVSEFWSVQNGDLVMDTRGHLYEVQYREGVNIMLRDYPMQSASTIGWVPEVACRHDVSWIIRKGSPSYDTFKWRYINQIPPGWIPANSRGEQ